MSQHHSPLTTAVAFAALALGASCSVGDVDRTQPNKIRKSVFAGEWYYTETVVDVPYSTTFTFIGEQTERTERVRWDVQEGYLIAYRSYALVAGTEAGGGGENAPIAVFPIQSHFDVKRDYNPTTGEQSNVLVENGSDRPWYEREWIRVDWSTNLAPNFLFAAQSIAQVPGSHYVQEPGDPDALLVARRAGDGWVDAQGDAIAELRTADYIDVVHRIMATPETIYVQDWDGTIYEEPACWYYTNADCTPSEITVRSAFLKVDEDDPYQPKEYPDNELARDEDGEPIRVSYVDRDSLTRDPDGFEVRIPYFDKFGFFRTERERYDRRHGETQSGKIHLINRWNIWADAPACVDDGAAAPYADCTVQPIVYHTSIGFPPELKDEAQRAIDQWNDAFKNVINHLKYGGARDLADVEDVVVLRDNTFKAGAASDRGQRIGDLRYNLLAWVDPPNQVGLLGYGPSATDPITGRIIAGNAFQYGAGVDEYAQYAKEIVELTNDPSLFVDFIEGDDVEASVHLRTADDPSPREKTQRFVRERVNSPKNKAKRAMGTRVLEADPSRTRARLEALRDTPLEARLAVDPLRRALSGTSSANPAALDGVDPAVASPANWAMGQAFRKERLRRGHLMKRSITHTRYFDPSVVGAALRLKDMPPEEVYQTIRAQVFASTTEHELGHTFGLRHNFEASTDALNYGTDYWDLKGEGALPLEAPSQAQLEAGIREHQYASIMDYGSRFMSDVHGLGLYDKAAIAFGYGDLVEVFEGAPDTNLLELLYLQDILKGFQHYTKLPDIFGGIDGMHARRFVPYQEVVDQLQGDASWDLWEVPYRFCSDDYEGSTATCAVFDEGADPYEIALAARTQYVEYFPFLSFSRDRRYFSEWDYMDRIFSRTFFPLLTQYQNWVFDGFVNEYYYDCIASDDGACDDLDRDDDAVYYGIENVPWAESGDGGLAGAAAARLLLDTVGEVLAQPEPGSYTYDAQDGILWAYSYYEDPVCPPGQIDDTCAELVVPFGEGRYTDSLWDVDSGYTFYDRLKMVGSFYDKLIALETAVTSDTYFLGVDTGAQVNRYAIGLSLYFPEEIHRLVGGTSAEDYPVYAGYTCVDDPAYHPPVLSELAAPRCEGGATQLVDPATSFTVELYAIWYGMAFLPFGFDLDFNDRMKIWLDGSGEQFTPADPTLVQVFTNPINNRVYRATRSADPTTYDPAAALLARAQRLADAYTLDPSTENLYRLQNLVTTIEDVRGTYEIYGTFYF